MICANTVFRCFKSIERAANFITGAAGPYFVALAVILITMGTVCFFDVVAPTLSYPFLSLPICVLIAINLFGHYYYVITVPPGFIDDGPREPGSSHTANSWLWAKKTSANGKGRHQRVLTGGVRWSARGVKITPAAQTKCNKCGRMRPEVCIFVFIRAGCDCRGPRSARTTARYATNAC
jgi:palmitoyltransferase